MEELRVSLPKALHAAKLLGAKALLIGVSTKDSNTAPLRKEMEAVQPEADACSIALRLVVNGQFWSDKDAELVESWKMYLEKIVLPQVKSAKSTSTFGTWPYSWKDDPSRTFNKQAIKEMKNLLTGAG